MFESSPPPLHTHPHTHTFRCSFHPSSLVKSSGYQQHAPFWLCRTFWWARNTEQHNWCDQGEAFGSHRCPVIRECLFLLKPYFQPLCHVQVFSSSSYTSSVFSSSDTLKMLMSAGHLRLICSEDHLKTKRNVAALLWTRYSFNQVLAWCHKATMFSPLFHTQH